MLTKDRKRREKKLDYFKEICKANSIKLTPQRLLIYEELMKSAEHPSTDMLYQKVRKIFPTISFDTVNRTLTTFYEIGLAHLIEGTGNPKRFDGNLEKHHHFQCIRCKRIIDVYDAAYDTIHIPPAIQARFKVLNITVRLEGMCDACQPKNGTIKEER